MMPVPESVFRAVQNSWYSSDWQENGEWLRMFQNARQRVGWAIEVKKNKATGWSLF